MFDSMDKKPVILAIETSGRTGSVALGVGEKILNETSFSGFMRHSAEIFPAIVNLLDKADVKPEKIGHLHISNGPGSFTGLRIAASIAKMMYLANSLKVVAVDSLDVIAFNAIEAIREKEQEANSQAKTEKDKIQKIAAVLDAKRAQFFVALYNIVREDANIRLEKVVPDYLSSAGEFINKYASGPNPIWLLGDGLVYHSKEFQSGGTYFMEEKYWSPRAAGVYRLGWEMAQKEQFADPVSLKPNYLCRPEIRVKQR
jgi:tRNA threonylcarbamoyladenosine biosynthesis protein TsaB